MWFWLQYKIYRQARPLTRLLAGVGLANVVIYACLLSNVAIAELGGPFPGDMSNYLW
ncbi:hypothetical protein GT352_40810 [Streptomyces sp. SID1046]|uniref:hypothetical protein n=1 Tax=Streptomyces sp. SID1046 TaxID=2690249 RepID=UPI00136FE392|nr:hypothetical protein [Streptomyces sp. SID1046]MYV80194.1 hypothetical protein [Streptomyces sp. SID1046]